MQCQKIQLGRFKTIIIAMNPRRFIKQELIGILWDEKSVLLIMRLFQEKLDFRAYVIYVMSQRYGNVGLTRYAMEAGNYLVNSSQGGGIQRILGLWRINGAIINSKCNKSILVWKIYRKIEDTLIEVVLSLIRLLIVTKTLGKDFIKIRELK